MTVEKIRTVKIGSEYCLQGKILEDNGESFTATLILPGKYGKITKQASLKIENAPRADEEVNRIFQELLLYWNNNPEWDDKGQWKKPEEWMKDNIQDSYIVECVKDGVKQNLTVEGRADMRTAKKILKQEGYTVLRMVEAKGHHQCPKCGCIVKGTDSDKECEQCAM